MRQARPQGPPRPRQEEQARAEKHGKKHEPKAKPEKGDRGKREARGHEKKAEKGEGKGRQKP